MRLNIKTKRRSKTLLIASIAILGIAIAYGIFAKQTNSWPFIDSQNASDATTIQGTDDPSQSTINDQKQNDLEKQQEAESEAAKNSQGNSSTKKQVEVIITTYSQTDSEILINGFAKNIIEKGGVCTLTLTDEAGKKVSRSRNAEVNATNTTCGQSIIPLSALHDGAWTAALSYASNTASGVSQPDAIPQIEVK